MAQAHGDRLTAVDASFLAQEGANSHMHVGAVLIFEGPPPDYEDFCNQIRGRLHLVPRYRQKLAVPPLETGRPLWVDDPSFNLDYHVRHTALPSPGSEEQLRALAARVHSQQLDRAKPLWETWLVQGLEGNRFALISKTHHALVDGVAGVDLATVLFDAEPVPPVDAARGRAVGAAGRAERRAARRARGQGPDQDAVRADRPRARRRPRGRRETLEVAREAIEGIGEVAWAGLNPAPETPLNVPIGPHRRFVFVRNELADYKLVKDALGGTVNDVVLTVVAGALRRWLRARGVRTEGARAARARAGLDPRQGRAPPARQPDRRDARAAARLRRGPGGAPGGRAQGDGRPEGLQAGGRRRGAGRRAELRAADGPRAGVADQLLHAPVQPDRDQRAGAAVPALRARAASCWTCSRSRSCRATTRSRWRSCPTTAGSTSGCSATTTRCPTSRTSARDLDDVAGRAGGGGQGAASRERAPEPASKPAPA